MNYFRNNLDRWVLLLRSYLAASLTRVQLIFVFNDELWPVKRKICKGFLHQIKLPPAFCHGANSSSLMTMGRNYTLCLLNSWVLSGARKKAA